MHRCHASWGLWPAALGSFLAVGSPGVEAQAVQADTVLVNGRIEDAETRVPLSGALVVAGDSSGAVYTDPAGYFALRMATGPTYVLFAELFGYQATEFELGQVAPEQLSVLRLPPLSRAEGFSVLDDAGFATLVNGLDARRERYGAVVRTYERADLDRFAGATIRDFLARTLTDAGPCAGIPQLLCRPGRYDRGDQIDPVLVCLDETIAARGAVDLETLPVASVARVELYAPESGWGLVGEPFRGGQVRIYTARWMIDHSGRNPHSLRPLRTGC